MIRLALVGFVTFQQAKFCAAVADRLGLASFCLALFFCLLANSIAIHWWRHG